MFGEIKSLNEECGLFGIWDNKNALDLTYYGLHSLQHRGQEGAGICSTDGEKIYGYKDKGLLAEVFKNGEIKNLHGNSAIGHVRYATSGGYELGNIQPFVFRFTDSSMALAHNGNLTNATSLKKELEKTGSIFSASSDSEILMHLIKRGKSDNFMDNLKSALQQVKGGFAYLLLTEDALYTALDPNGFRPLAIGKKDGSYVVASETCAFDVIGAEFVRDVEPGEVIKIDSSGMTIDHFETNVQHSICSMEYIYFARPDSNIGGVNVHYARKRMGINLAKEVPVEADLVTGVPDSSISAAIGYAEASKIPYELGLIKNRYVGRTFIEPSQVLRELGVKMKLSAVRSIVKGKRIVMVDDSIVRGTTSKRIVGLLREAGAKEIHVRIASPSLKYPCFYGIDIRTRKELIAANYTKDEICKIIGADSLEFLSIDGLVDAIGRPYPNDKYGGITVSYFNGDYPTPLYDYEEEYLEDLKQFKIR